MRSMAGWGDIVADRNRRVSFSRFYPTPALRADPPPPGGG